MKFETWNVKSIASQRILIDYSNVSHNLLEELT